jgi:hypothetical protein
VSTGHERSAAPKRGSSALIELADDIDRVAAQGKGEVLANTVLTPAELDLYYEEVERVAEAQKISDDDATQLHLR